MQGLWDILIERPLAPGVLRAMLFPAFAAHIILALLTVGSAILAIGVSLRKTEPGRTPPSKHFMEHFFVYKSLAVVLGVAPLLLMQVANTVPFLTAINLHAASWMMIVVLLIAGFVLLDYYGINGNPDSRWTTAAGLAGFVCLLCVPAIFVAVVVTTENPGGWAAMLARSAWVPAGRGLHYSARFVHVLGAAVVLGAAFHYFRQPLSEPGARRRLLRWIAAALAVQLAAGLALFLSLSPVSWLRAGIVVPLVIAVVCAFAFLALVFKAQITGSGLARRSTAGLLAMVILPMLWVRQDLQDAALAPLSQQLATGAEQHEAAIQPFRTAALGTYEAKRVVAYDNPSTIYSRSCQFCHGTVGNGRGDEAPNLKIQPEDISAIRTTPEQLHRILLGGVRGTAMPVFGVYTRGQLQQLIGFLHKPIGVAPLPEQIPVKVSDDAVSSASQTFAMTCATCHGTDGRGTYISRQFLPAPPDLSRMTLSPRRAFNVITQGYPGTAMPSFAMLPEQVRWALVRQVHVLYRP